VFLFQEERTNKRPGALLTILLRRSDELVPEFIRALQETDQGHVARLLGYQGLRTFVVLAYLLYTSSRLSKYR